MAVDRALALLPREIENIRLIQEECERVLATAPASQACSATGASQSRGEVEHSGREEVEHSGMGEAQILLLHTETALEWLSGSTTTSPQGVGSTGQVGRDGLPCTTFQQFVERSSVAIGGIAAGSESMIDLLIDRVVVDGEQIKVRFKAGVEI